MRKEILEFAEQMEKVMAAHDATKGDSWKEMDVSMLCGLMSMKFYGNESHSFGDSPNDHVDMANFCMMIWHKKWIKKAKGEKP